jgi:hypothetical protein
MTEADWSRSADPQPMLEYLRAKASNRKLRLFASAWCRHRCPELLQTPQWTGTFSDDANDSQRQCSNGLEVAEQFADGLSTKAELSSANATALAWANAWGNYDLMLYYQAALVAFASCPFNREVSVLPPRAPYAQGPDGDAALTRDLGRQADLLREIMGNPFRPVAINTAWLTWNNAAAPKLAQSIYDDRAFDRLPLLADALVAAGCTNEDILAHCRSGGEHVRGCWVVDLVLGKG